ncbi:MAG: hypothetical protein JXR76_03670 [Deltaproteobacteria bacterium]|nr:hypothetical protein [Deltaproteobacteria bacterium]
MILRIVQIFGVLLVSVVFAFGCSEKPSEVEMEIAATPSRAARGQTITVAVVSSGLSNKGLPVITISPRDGLSLSPLRKTGPLRIEFDLTVHPNAPLGNRVLSVKLGDAHGDCEFSIDAEVAGNTDSNPDTETGTDGVPGSTDIGTATDSGADLLRPILDVRPSTLFTGKVSEVSIFGTNTHFSASSTVSFPAGSGLVVEKVEYLGATLTDGEQLSLAVRTDSAASVGSIIGTVQSPVNTDVETANFTIEVIASPGIDVFPSTGLVGESTVITINGNRTHFQTEPPATLLLIEPSAKGVSINLDAISNQNEMVATVYASNAALVGEYTITATTTVDYEQEVVSAVFTVKDKTSDTDSGEEDSNTDDADTCNDFKVIPSAIPIGSFNKTVRFEAAAGVAWSEDRAISFSNKNGHLYLDSPQKTPATRCILNTSTDISCPLTAGVLATPGDYAIHVESGGKDSCGMLTIAADDIEPIVIPAEPLPNKIIKAGELSPGTNVSDFYSFSASEGTTAVFHAYSLERSTMDPVLRLIDGAGDNWIAFEDDETPMGIDARLVYHFSETADYFIEVGPKLSSNEGPYQLYVHQLTHGNIRYETETGNDAFETAQTIDDPMGAVVYATAETETDVDYYYFETKGPATINIVARRLAQIDDAFADTRITLYNAAQIELDSNSAWYEMPSTGDPRLFVAEAGSYYIKVEAEAQTSGFYALNVRSYLVINEIDNRTGIGDPWVELQGAYNVDLADYELCTFNRFLEPIDSETPCISLEGFSTDADGYVAIFATDFAGDTMMLPEGIGAVQLLHEGSVMDQVQFGTDGINTLVEDEASDVGMVRVIGRAAGVNSNNNKKDFMYMASPTPGMPNDRNYPSAVPLYGERLD